MKLKGLPPLRPGDPLAVVAPAGLPDPDQLAKGLALLRSRYRVLTYRDLPPPAWGMHAGVDGDRREELRWALEGSEARAVIAARGGYGTSRIVDERTFELLAGNPKIIVGFSDITVLLLGALGRCGLRAIHGPMVCQLGRRGASWPSAHLLFHALESSTPLPAIGPLRTLHPGRARGPLIGGNLTVLTHLIGTALLPSLDGAVLFIEDVGERPYRLDRCLGQLKAARLLEGAAGIVVGDLVDCEAVGGEHGASEIVERFCRDLALPAVSGLRAGHGRDNVPLVLGAEVELDADSGTLSFLQGLGAGDAQSER